VTGSGAAPWLWLYYGGTFDPIHLGHLAIARAARDELAVPVRLVPAADPPHRAPPGADAAQRARMIALAIGDEPGLALDLRELRRADAGAAPSYTVDTLAALRAELGAEARIAWLLGGDSLATLDSWHRWRDLLQLAHLVVAERPGIALEHALPPALADYLGPRWTGQRQALEAAPAGRVLRLHAPLRAESASAVRQRIAAHRDWRGLVPAAVADDIVRRGLYGAGAS
jgi:nicotinate-nucleotide adenylyltransferase